MDGTTIKKFSGTIRVDQPNPDKSRVDVEIDAASIDTGEPDRDAHLRSRSVAVTTG